jgi:serine/threonine protein phosphatase PrpC
MPIPIPTAAPVTVRLPNATAGRPYSQPIDLARLPQLAGWQLLALQIPAGSGLSFDAATCQLQGTPQAPAGQTHEWPFQGRLVRADGSGSERPIRLDLLVNPDPRSLWKEIEPEPGKPFAKPHQQAHVRREASWQAVAASQRGRSHANVGSFREDHFHFTAHEGWILLAVSDGAGSAKLSRRGSELACETAIQTLQDDGKSHLSALAALVDAGLASGSRDELHDKVQFPLGTAAFMACKAIGDEAKRLGREEKEFAATLLLAAVRPHAEGFFVASYWIGDGALAIFDPSQSTVQLLGEADGGEFSGQTRFLLATEFKPDPWEQMKKRIRSAWAAKTATLVLMSDGVSDPKFGTDNALKDPARWQQWWQDLAAEVDLHGSDDASLSEQLLRYLAFWSPGEHDDRTLALWQFAASPAAGSRA